MTNITWKELYNKAKKFLNYTDVSPLVKAGKVASSIFTSSGNVYVGVNIESACGIGLCAERNAANNMITNGDSKILKIVCLDIYGKIRIPCGVCREYLMQLNKDNSNIEILIDLEQEKTIKLKDLLPNWWAEDRF